MWIERREIFCTSLRSPVLKFKFYFTYFTGNAEFAYLYMKTPIRSWNIALIFKMCSLANNGSAEAKQWDNVTARTALFAEYAI